ncbi:MAG: EAL domain-containing protein [Acidimicrobiales bacterium]
MSAVTDRLLTPVALVAGDSTLLYANAAAARAIGQEPEWLVGRRMLDFVHPDDRPRIRAELLRVAGGRPSAGLSTFRLRNKLAQQWRVFESTATNLLDHPDIEGILLSSRDITEQLDHERQLHDLAYLDPLTGLPNRVNLENELDTAMTGGGDLTVAFVGIDRLMLINDTLGPNVGDSALQAVAARICSSVPPNTVVGRFAGNMLAMLIRGIERREAEGLLWECVSRAAEPMFIAGHEFRLSVSAGVAHRHAAANRESLLRDAGLAHSQAKTEGGGRVAVASKEMFERAVDRLELESRIRYGIAHSEFSLALQPIVRLEDAVPVRSEALVRWNAEGVSRAPCEFIPVAEETGLILPLGNWIIDRAVQLASRSPGGPIMVNLSARQLAVPGLPERIRRTLSRFEVAPDAVGFEVTETLLMQNFEFGVEVISDIRRLGCQVGLDDFGTGYSSLSYLRRLPIDFVKIDQTLTAEIDSDPRARLIVGAVVDMVSALHQDVVAEGVETEAQAVTLGELGCRFAQGYYFGRPVEVTD